MSLKQIISFVCIVGCGVAMHCSAFTLQAPSPMKQSNVHYTNSIVQTTFNNKINIYNNVQYGDRTCQPRKTLQAHNLFDKMFEEDGPLGKGITVGKVQVALNSMDRSNDSIFGLLDMASRSSDDSSEGLADLCHEICMSLLRKKDDWVSAASSSKWFSNKDAGKAESLYNEWTNTEATKFEKEYLPDSKQEPGGPTLVVVSLILEIEGDNTVFDKAGFSRAETTKVLTSIASDVLVDEGQVVNAFEVLWSPGDNKEVLTSRDIIVDFPELIDL